MNIPGGLSMEEARREIERLREECQKKDKKIERLESERDSKFAEVAAFGVVMGALVMMVAIVSSNGRRQVPFERPRRLIVDVVPPPGWDECTVEYV